MPQGAGPCRIESRRMVPITAAGCRAALAFWHRDEARCLRRHAGLPSAVLCGGGTRSTGGRKGASASDHGDLQQQYLRVAAAPDAERLEILHTHPVAACEPLASSFYFAFEHE